MDREEAAVGLERVALGPVGERQRQTEDIPSWAPAESRLLVEPCDDVVIARIRNFHRHRRLPPPTTASAVARAEAAVGHQMPPLLKRIYLEIADGGFDDRAGALSLSVAVGMVTGTVDSGNNPEVCDQGPAGVVPLRFWGCQVWTHVDWRTHDGRLWAEDDDYVYPETLTLAERLIRWMDGDEGLPQAWHAQGRPVWIDGENGDWSQWAACAPTGLRSVHDDKAWRVTTFRHGHRYYARGLSATIAGPLPGGGQGETQVLLTRQPGEDWWWMELDTP